jgi:hypothetical protein
MKYFLCALPQERYCKGKCSSMYVSQDTCHGFGTSFACPPRLSSRSCEELGRGQSGPTASTHFLFAVPWSPPPLSRTTSRYQHHNHKHTSTPPPHEQASSTNKQLPARVSVANGICLVTTPRLLHHFFVAYRRRTGSPKPRGFSTPATSYKEIPDPTPKSTLSVPRQPIFTSARDSRAA